jgi:hypothetical protein
MNSKADKCDICDNTFTTKYSLKRHNYNIHKVSPEAEVSAGTGVSSGAEVSPEAKVSSGAEVSPEAEVSFELLLINKLDNIEILLEMICAKLNIDVNP